MKLKLGLAIMIFMFSLSGCGTANTNSLLNSCFASTGTCTIVINDVINTISKVVDIKAYGITTQSVISRLSKILPITASS